MFNNLIESSEHNEELKRRGSFFIGTLAIYAALFFVAGLVSIYAYDAQLESQSLEMVTLVSPVQAVENVQRPQILRQKSVQSSSDQQRRDIRTALVDDVNHPANAPVDISVKPGNIPPVRSNMPTAIGADNINAGVKDSPTGLTKADGVPGIGTNGATPLVKIADPPPAFKPQPDSKPKPALLNVSRLLNGQATYLPKPTYPAIAIAAHASGTVVVQILIDESGKVISARAVSGHPLLMQPAVQAAYQARFTPTVLSDQRVKVSGVINYNFTH